MPSDTIYIKRKLSYKAKVIILALFFFSLLTVFRLENSPSSALIDIDILSSSSELTQLFWLENEQEYSQSRSVSKRLEVGGATYRLKIDPSYNIKRLRLDPATRPSTIAIEQISLVWDGEVVFKLAGRELQAALKPEHSVSLTLDQKNGRVIVTATGNDPIIELNTKYLTRDFKSKNLLKQVGVSLFCTFLVMILLSYITSSRYMVNSHCTYPGKTKHWLNWGALFVFLGMFLLIVTPVKLLEQSSHIHFAALSYLTGMILFIPAFWFTTRELKYTVPGNPGCFGWLWFALPSFIIWFFYLLSFWPAAMSPDSLDQWRQVLNGHFRDWHPAFHTMNIWLITKIKLSPATAAIAQLLALGSAAGWILSVFQRYGVPKAALWVASLIFALMPVNGFMVVTLWKDIAYSTVLLILAIYIFQIVIQNGVWLTYPKNWLLLGITLALVSLYRHNGILPACVISFLLICCYRRYWKGIIFASILALAIHTGVRGPLYDVVEVKRGTPLMKVEQKLKKSFRALFGKKPDVADSLKKNKQAEGDKGSKFPDEIMDRIYTASRVWRIFPMDHFHRRIAYVNLWHEKNDNQLRIRYVSSNKLGIEEDPVLPAGTDLLYSVFNESRYNKYLFWMWRPAVYLYILAGMLILQSWRLRKKLYLVIIPSLLNSLPMFLVVMHKSVFRYHYPVVILGMLTIIPLLALNPTEKVDQSVDVYS